MKRNSGLLAAILFLFHAGLFAQDVFTVHLVPSTIQSIPAMHSGAFATWNSKWIFIGGRLDGLHIMQANSAFPTFHRNDSIFVIDPVTDTRWSADATTIPPAIFDAISSSNMEYGQDSIHLYMIGGYGSSSISGTYITFPSLISIDLPSLVNAVINGTNVAPSFRQLSDTVMAVAGGAMEKIDSTWYLVGGHRFDGRYDNLPMHMFTQTYTNEIRKFVIHDDGVNLSFSNYQAERDTDNLHRRDFTLMPQIFPGGIYGMTLFGGVFQKNIDRPFHTPVDITSSGFQHQAGFNQNLNQYTTAAMPVFDSTAVRMHNVFFGGMSLYTLDTTTNTLVQDTLVPFVKTISNVTRDAAGSLSESRMHDEMPGFIGTNSLFIPDTAVARFYNRIISLNPLSGIQRVGFLVGGIRSDAANIGALDPEGMSRPNAQVYEVQIDKTISSVNELQVNNVLNDLLVYPNPAQNILSIDFSMSRQALVDISLFTTKGELVKNVMQGQSLSGNQHLTLDVSALKRGTYFLKMKSGASTKMVKCILER